MKKRWIAAVLLPLLIISPAAGDAIKVALKMPVPPKINTTGVKNILVASFIWKTNVDIDINREAVRALRSELRKTNKFNILDVPPPNLPEQSLEDLLNNYQFWKHLGEEYDADLIVSGMISFNSSDKSGFVNVDEISPITGQKVRTTRYADREEFKLELSLYFFKGLNGAFLYEDNYMDSSIYEGKANDALQIFYDFNDRIKEELKGIITPQIREEERYIFLN